MMETAPDKLNKGGRLCVISFHSLEDRIVKNGIARREHGCTCPREAPVCTCGFVQTLRSVSRKPILPGEDEIERKNAGGDPDLLPGPGAEHAADGGKPFL